MLKTFFSLNGHWWIIAITLVVGLAIESFKLLGYYQAINAINAKQAKQTQLMREFTDESSKKLSLWIIKHQDKEYQDENVIKEIPSKNYSIDSLPADVKRMFSPYSTCSQQNNC